MNKRYIDANAMENVLAYMIDSASSYLEKTICECMKTIVNSTPTDMSLLKIKEEIAHDRNLWSKAKLRIAQDKQYDMGYVEGYIQALDTVLNIIYNEEGK